METSGKLWAVASYFNPVGYRRRLGNYRQFRKHLAVPLVTVELAFGPSFELQPGDADILVQIRGRDVMWQKERLLNVAIENVPGDCEAIAWLDVDVIFSNPNWPQQALEMLKEKHVVQLFSEIRSPGPEESLREDFESAEFTGRSIIRAVEEDGFERVLSPELAHLSGRDARILNGFAWAAKADILRTCKLYDACIIGIGDRALSMGALGNFEQAVDRLQMTPRAAAHYLNWATRYYDAVEQQVGYLPDPAYHLWHGKISSRQSQERRWILPAHDFDPARDLRMAPDGPWEWNSPKPELHAAIRAYFESRREDG